MSLLRGSSRSTSVIIVVISTMIFLLIGAAFVLRKQNLTLKHDIQRRQEEARLRKERLEFNFYESKIRGDKLSFTNLEPVIQNTASFNEELCKEYSIILLFSRLTCETCVERELMLLQELFNKYSDGNLLGVLALVNESDSMELLDRARRIANFPILQEVQEESIFSKFNIPHNRPLTLFVKNSNSRIIWANIAINNDEDKSLSFIGVVKRFLDGPPKKLEQKLSNRLTSAMLQ